MPRLRCHRLPFRWAQRVAEYSVAVEHEAIVNKTIASTPIIDGAKSSEEILYFVCFWQQFVQRAFGTAKSNKAIEIQRKLEAGRRQRTVQALTGLLLTLTSR